MTITTHRSIKPLGAKAYGHIAHLPNSRLGPGDHKLHEGQARILTEKARDKHDIIIVTEKLDGTNVCVARVNGVLIPLIRAGYPAISSKYRQHGMFAEWVYAPPVPVRVPARGRAVVRRVAGAGARYAVRVEA